jgi:hypothetical protein
MMYGVVARRSRPLLTTFFASVAIAALAAGCSGGDKKADAKPPAPPAADPRVVLKAGHTDVESYGPDTKISKAVQATMLAGAQKFVDTAITVPLQTGKVAETYGAQFDSTIRPAAVGADVNVLSDAAVGKASRFTERASPVDITALAGNAGKFVYYATTFKVNYSARTRAGTVGAERNVELTFTPVGGKWVITAYRVTTRRTSAAGTTTTTAKSGSTP